MVVVLETWFGSVVLTEVTRIDVPGQKVTSTQKRPHKSGGSLRQTYPSGLWSGSHVGSGPFGAGVVVCRASLEHWPGLEHLLSPVVHLISLDEFAGQKVPALHRIGAVDPRGQ